jgi:membrane protein DedA with SNARE-associated domain
METIVDFILNFSGPMPYIIVFVILLACGLGLPIPEDVTLFVAGILAYCGVFPLPPIIIICLAGVLIGDLTIYGLGYHFGRKLTKKWLFHKLLPDERLNNVQRRFHKTGNKLIFAARFMPGLRAPIYFSAGTLHLPFRVFIFYDGCAAMASVPAIIGAVYFFGDELDRVIRVIKGIEHSIFLMVFAVVLAVAAKWYITHRKLKRA